MLVPGSNLLNLALRAINPQPFTYIRNLGRTTNIVGQDIATYDAPVQKTGSVQPLNRSLYTQYGLDFQKNYWNIYCSTEVTDVNRDVSGDQFIFNGMKLQALSKTPWFGVDGWDVVLTIQVPST